MKKYQYYKVKKERQEYLGCNDYGVDSDRVSGIAIDNANSLLKQLENEG